MNKLLGLMGQLARLRRWSSRYPNGRLAVLSIAAPPAVMWMAIGIKHTQLLLSGRNTLDTVGKRLFGITLLISAILLTFACVRALVHYVERHRSRVFDGDSVNPPAP